MRRLIRRSDGAAQVPSSPQVAAVRTEQLIDALGRQIEFLGE
jgi:hypothetical protein